MKKELRYDEWPLIYSALTMKLSFHQIQMERFDTDSQEDVEIYAFHAEQAESYHYLQEKIDRLANQAFPIVNFADLNREPKIPYLSDKNYSADACGCPQCETGKLESGTPLGCPHCAKLITVYDTQWDAIQCPKCKSDVDKDDWKIIA